MELFRLLGRIVIENTEANRILNDTVRNANDSSNRTSKAFEKIGKAAKGIAIGIGTVGAAVGGAFIATIEGTREYLKEMGLLESAFKTAGHSSETAKRTYSELNAVLGDTGQAVEAAQHLALIADNESELNDMTHTLTGVYATFGASLPLEGLAEAINYSSSLGEVQGNLADALEWSGITVDDFNAQLAECSTEEERQDLIMNTLRNTYSKAAELLNLPGVPKFSVKWNALGALLKNPSIFGNIGNTFLGGGESGSEALLPLERNTGWMDLIADRLLERIQYNTNDNDYLIRRIDKIISLLEELLNMGIYLDSGVLVGELSPSINARLGDLYKHNERGNTR